MYIFDSSMLLVLVILWGLLVIVIRCLFIVTMFLKTS